MRLLRVAAIVVAMSLVAVACGESGPTPVQPVPGSPGASHGTAETSTAPSTLPTPEPTPVDVARLTATMLADPAFTATVAIAGTSTVGTVKATTSGTLDIEGRASHAIRTVKTGKTVAASDTIIANGTRYGLQKGVWVELGDSNRTELVAILRATTSLTDLGVEAKDGRSLHHLQATALPGVPEELGLASSATEATASLDMWVTDDGTPVVATVTASWKQLAGDKTVAGTSTTDFTFSNVGGDVTVAPPDRVWAFHTSARFGYRMACPVEWTYKKGTSTLADSCYEANQGVYSSRARQSNVSLSFLTGKIPGQLKSAGYRGVKIDSNRKTKLDGVPARRIEFRATVSGDKVWGQAVYAVKGAWWYFIVWEDFEQTTNDDRALFKQFLGTFDFK